MSLWIALSCFVWVPISFAVAYRLGRKHERDRQRRLQVGRQFAISIPTLTLLEDVEIQGLRLLKGSAVTVVDPPKAKVLAARPVRSPRPGPRASVENEWWDE